MTIDRGSETKVGHTPELEAEYEKIKEKIPMQRDAYKDFVDALQESDKSSMVGSMKSLGLDVDLSNGALTYAQGFQPQPLPFHICYIRHGKTLGNTEPRIYQGQIDYPENKLNEVGLQHAKDAADLMDKEVASGWTPDLIVLSPIHRARETAAPFIERHPQIPTVVIHETKEMAFGNWDNVKVKDMPAEDPCHLFYLEQNAVIRATHPHKVGSNWFDDEHKVTATEIPQENMVDVILRISAALKKVEAEVLKVCPNATKDNPAKVLMYGHSMVGAALSITRGCGKSVEGTKTLSFDGKYIMPFATPAHLPPTSH